MSYSLFRKTFKEITGLSPHQYRLTIRLHRAERLLRSTNMQISRIAEILGFSSIYYFSELFKKKTGQSPLEYRKEII
jgi:AraC-like DNA-binding protein